MVEEFTTFGFGSRLRAAIKLSGLTQTAVALRLGTAAARISEWSNGHSTPDYKYLSRLPEALGVSGHWLITGHGSMARTESEVHQPHHETLLKIAALCEEAVLSDNKVARKNAHPRGPPTPRGSTAGC
jgi:transcriptional regulator with XRE-family HTH domain